MTFAEEVRRDALAAGLSPEIADLIAAEVTKPRQAQARIDEVRKQASMLQLCGAPTLLRSFVEARLSLDDAKHAVHQKLKRGFLRTAAIEDLRADASAGRLKRPAPVATTTPPPTLEEIGAQVYRRPGASA